MTHTFATVVKQSRVLSSEQKALFLEDWEALPETYRAKVMKFLLMFDEHSKARERYLREKLNATYQDFEQRLVREGVEANERNMLLEKARKQINAFFPPKISV